MKNIKAQIMILFFSCFLVQANGQKIWFNVMGKKGKPISDIALSNARSFTDLNAGYPSSWIDNSAYVSRSVSINGDIAISTDKHTGEKLTDNQVQLLTKAEMFSTIDIEVIYYIENIISQKEDLDTMNFSITVAPAMEAQFVGGYGELKDYFKNNAMDRILAIKKTDDLQANIQFTIDTHGAPKDLHINTSSKDKEIDKIIIEAINGMPQWTPAENKEGIKLDQNFEFVLGNIGC